MGYQSYIDGEIRINPPLTAAELVGSPYHDILGNGYSDRYKPNIRIRVVELDGNSATTGLIRIRTGIAIEGSFDGERFNAYTIEDDLRGFIRHHKPVGNHALEGFLIRVGEESGDVERYTFDQYGNLKTEQAEMRWPDGSLVDKRLYEL